MSGSPLGAGRAGPDSFLAAPHTPPETKRRGEKPPTARDHPLQQPESALIFARDPAGYFSGGCQIGEQFAEILPLPWRIEVRTRSELLLGLFQGELQRHLPLQGAGRS